jgi:hypothetical protein
MPSEIFMVLDAIKDQISKESAGNIIKRRRFLNSLKILYLPEFLFIAVVLIVYLGDNALRVWTFIYGYKGFAEGLAASPILPYTLFMAGSSFAAIIIVLLMAGVRLWRSFLVALSTPLAAIWLFEFVWDLIFLIRSGNFSSWFGFPGPIINYFYAFLFLVAFWIVGIRYWRFSLVSVLLWICWLVTFGVWDFRGYPQSGFVFVVNYPYVINVVAKVLTFIILTSPVVSWGMKRIHDSGFHRSPEPLL